MYLDTMVREADLPTIDRQDFDEIVLVSPFGTIGAEVWQKIKLVQPSPRGATIQPSVSRRLLVIADDSLSEESVRRARAAIGAHGITDWPGHW